MIVLVFGVILVNGDYESLQEYKGYNEARQNMIQECKKVIKASADQEKIKECKTAIEKESSEYDFYTVLTDVLVWKVQFIYYLAFLIVVIPSLLKTSKLLKNKYIMNSNSRESYHSFLKKLFCIAYQYIWILPLLSLILMIPLLLNTSLDPTHAILNGTSGWSSNIIHHPALFVISYLIYMILCSFTFINISLLVARKQQKFIPCIILSYILYYAIEIFFETVIGIILFTNILKTDFGIMFNILNIFSFNDSHGIFVLLLLNLAFAILSFGFVYLAYRNKEKLVIQCEKNK